MLFSVSSVLFFNRFSLGLQLIMGHPSDTDVLLPKERGAGGQARRRQQARAGEESGRACWQRLRQIKPVTIRHYCQEPQSSVQSSDVASKYQLSSEAVYPFCWGVSSDLVLYIRHETTVPGYKVSFFLLLKSHFWHAILALLLPDWLPICHESMIYGVHDSSIRWAFLASGPNVSPHSCSLDMMWAWSASNHLWRTSWVHDTEFQEITRTGRSQTLIFQT